MLRLGYISNGLTALTPVEAIEGLARIGYRGIGLSLDVDFLNPFQAGIANEVEKARKALERCAMGAVIETGARFLLNPQTKHEPTLLSAAPSGRARRIDFLCRAIDIAADLGAPCVSLWSGRLPDQGSPPEAFERLADGLCRVLEYAERRQIVIAFEPEPEMWIDTLRQYDALRSHLAAISQSLSCFRLTIDVGHLHCLGELPIADYLVRYGGALANVHIEDMRRGVHEHLMFGEGEIDFPPVIAALEEIGYTGLVNVELSRHSKEGLRAAARAYEFLRPLLECSSTRRRPLPEIQ